MCATSVRDPDDGASRAVPSTRPPEAGGVQYARDGASPIDPIRPDEPVSAALSRYLAENGLRAADYELTHFDLRVRGVAIRLPNPRSRRAAVAFHDLHHVATGLSTDWISEILISAWEIGAGLGGLWVARLICVPFFAAGLVVRPRSTWSAYRTGRSCRSLFARPACIDELLALRVGDLRDRIGLPPQGLTLR
jgi:hypothetical protein